MLIDIDDKLIAQIGETEDIKPFIENLIRQSFNKNSISDDEFNQLLTESMNEHDQLLQLLAK